MLGNNGREIVISLQKHSKRREMSLSEFFPTFLSIVGAFLKDCRQVSGPCCLLSLPPFGRRHCSEGSSSENNIPSLKSR